MSKAISFDEAIQSIHRTLGEAEHQLSRLGERLQFLVGPRGEVSIVRRGKTGDTLRPKVVIARLRGCDPMLWRPEHPRWLRILDPARDAEADEAAEAGPEAKADTETETPEAGTPEARTPEARTPEARMPEAPLGPAEDAHGEETGGPPAAAEEP